MKQAETKKTSGMRLLHSVKQGRVDGHPGLGWLRLGGDLWGVCSLCGRSAAVVDAGGDLGGASDGVTVDSTVELNDCGLGGHGCVTILHQTPLTAEQDAETPVEL